MRLIVLINLLLGVGLLAVIAGTASMFYAGFNDSLSYTCFILHSANAFLLLVREALC